MIDYENLRSFCYSNDRLIEGAPRGIAVNFCGLGFKEMFDKDPDDGVSYAADGVILVIPYLDPWAWMNSVAVAETDAIVSALEERYGPLPVVSSGGSMGGEEAIVWCAYSKKNIVACVANCPVCDMEYHLTERPDLPRTMYAAFSGGGDFRGELAAHSPVRLAERLPRIPYSVFHCEEDRAVNLAAHSEKFVAAMEAAGRDITFTRIPGRGHCDLSPDGYRAYRAAIMNALNVQQQLSR